jgi:hypothetical protein
MRRVLGSKRCRMVEFLECSSDVAWHGDVNVSFVIVPVEGEAAVQFAGPVDG